MELLDFYPSSPVVADRWLWEGELPFTAFGQHGIDNLDIRVFEQGVWWVDRYGQEHLLREMTTDYLRNVKTHLVSFGESFYSSACRRYAIEIHMAYGGISGAPADMEGLKGYLDGKKDPRAQDWFSWLEESELYAALTELLSSRV